MPSLDQICAGALQAALDPTAQAFNRQLRNGSWAPTSAAETISGSLICLIGADRAGISFEGLVPGETLDVALAGIRRSGQPGAVGLAVWAAAVIDGPEEAEVLAGAGDRDAARLCERLTTMELAWLVSGLLHQHARRGEHAPITSLLTAAAAVLLARQCPSGLMLHAGQGAPAPVRLRGGVANFADQVYSLQALALAALRGIDSAAGAALTLARAVTDRQGPLGQWWWHYHAQRGTVASRYPVYAVHQHGMAPMAFAALGRAAGDEERWTGVAQRGRQWLWRNELGRSLVDESVPTIWRSVERAERRAARWLRRARYMAGGEDADAIEPALVLNRETRPYEWAWQLYASAITRRLDRGRHIV